MYTRQKVDGTFDKRFLIGLIVSDRFNRDSKQLYRRELASSEPQAIIADWCYKYYEKYEKAPSRQIQDIFDEKSEEIDEELSEFIEDLLVSLNEEWEHAEKFNEGYLLDETEKHFKLKSLLKLSSDIRVASNRGDILEAETLLSSFNAIERVKSKGVDPLIDKELIKRSVEAMSEDPLFRLPGVLGEIMNPQFRRKALIGIQGPEKRGKTYWIDELALRALRGRCNTAIFDCGDMSEEEKAARLHSHLSMKPLKMFHNPNKPIYYPVIDCVYNQDGSCNSRRRPSDVSVITESGTISPEEAEQLGYIPCNEKCPRKKNTVWHEIKYVEPLTEEEAIEAGKKFVENARGKRLRTFHYPMNTLNCKKINNILEIEKNENGILFDVILIDYPGIMEAEDNKKDSRNQVNDTWKGIRWLSQIWNACVIVVDQTDADSYDKSDIKLKNFTEDKRKYGHVTAMYSLNQTDEERAKGIMRIGELLIRQGATDAVRKIHVLECRALGRINLGSYL